MFDKNSQARDSWIDVLKGLGICLVVFGHIYLNPSNHLLAVIYSFHMPLFFFASGLLYHKKEIWKDFFISKTKRILFPYFLWAFLSFLYWLVIERQFRSPEAQMSPLKGFLGIFYAEYDWLMYNVVLWFLPVLFGVFLLFDAIVRLKCHILYKILLILSCSVIGFLLLDTPLLWGIDRMFRYIPFFALGYITRKLLQTKRLQLHSPLTIIGYLVFGCLNFYLTQRQLFHSWWFYLTAISGILCCCCLAFLLSSQKAFIFLGQNTMPIYLMHGPYYRALIYVIARFTNTTTELLRNHLTYSLSISIIVLVSLSLLTLLINKYVPWSVGKYPNNRV